ncbi:hypothetical protein D9M68_718730 [compost metagenome]
MERFGLGHCAAVGADQATRISDELRFLVAEKLQVCPAHERPLLFTFGHSVQGERALNGHLHRMGQSRQQIVQLLALRLLLSLVVEQVMPLQFGLQRLQRDADLQRGQASVKAVEVVDVGLVVVIEAVQQQAVAGQRTPVCDRHIGAQRLAPARLQVPGALSQRFGPVLGVQHVACDHGV